MHSILGPPACWQMPLGLQGKPTCLLQWSHSGDPLGLGSQLHLTLLSEVRASVEPPSSSVSPSEKNGHLDNSHLCMLLGTGKVLGSCSDPQGKGGFPMQCHSIPESHQSSNPDTREGSASPHQGHRLLWSPVPSLQHPPQTRFLGRTVTGSTKSSSAHPDLRPRQPQQQQLNSYRGVAGPSRPRLGWYPLLPLPGILAVQLAATLVTGATRED